MQYVDTHAHYYDDRFSSEENPIGPITLLQGLFDTTLCAVVNIGTSPDTSRMAIAQARRFPRMYTAVGIHPTDGQLLADPDAALADLEALAKSPDSKCVAIGEIGLDYHYPDTDRERQIYLFEEQLRLSVRLGLPVSIHDRDAHGDVMDILRAHPRAFGVMHSFSGSPEMARELVSMGYYISFSGTVTFKNARRAVESVAVVPPERILIETDAPYLAPHPVRGTLNHSGNLVYINRRISELLSMDEAACAALLSANAERLFRLPDQSAAAKL